jgi:hypothetical protein
VVWIAELINRRGWMNAADMAEALAVGKILPGLTGVTMLIFLAPCLRRPIAPLLALVPLMLPGCVIMLVLSTLTLGTERPAWLNSVITGVGVGALGMLLSTLGPLLSPGLRGTRWLVLHDRRVCRRGHLTLGSYRRASWSGAPIAVAQLAMDHQGLMMTLEQLLELAWLFFRLVSRSAAATPFFQKCNEMLSPRAG